MYLLVNGSLIVIWAMTGAGFFWPVFPIVGWGIGVAASAWDAYSQVSGTGNPGHGGGWAFRWGRGVARVNRMLTIPRVRTRQPLAVQCARSGCPPVANPSGSSLPVPALPP